MVIRKTEDGHIYHEPPYTEKEQEEFRRRINGDGPMTIIWGEAPPHRRRTPPQPPEE